MNIPMREQKVKHIMQSLNDMEEKGVVDLSILDELNGIKELLKSIKIKWLESKDSDSFYFYQAARNVELILDRMGDRFKKSKENKDNPQIAVDSMVLFPVMNDILKIAETQTVNDHTVYQVLNKTRDLRNAAASQNLIESPEEDLASIDKQQLHWEFENIMKNLDMPIHVPYKVVNSEEETEDNS